MNNKLKAAKYGYIVISVLIGVFGITLIAIPKLKINWLCWIGGILLAVFGCIKILGYFSKDLYQLAFQFDLAFGILLIVLGIMLILHLKSIIHIIHILLGIFVLSDSLVKIQTAVDAKEFGLPNWWLILITAVITSVFGFLLLFISNQYKTIIKILLGCAFLGEGILNLITVLIAVKILQRKTQHIENGN